MNKKILILNWRDPRHPHAGGAEQATLMHAKAWQKKGYDITWFSSSVDSLPIFEDYEDIHIIRKGYLVFGVQFEAYTYIQKNKFDLIVDQIHGLPFFTPLYVKNTPILAYIHEVAKEVVWHNPYPFPVNKIVGMLASTIEPLMYGFIYKSTPFMTVSESTRKELSDWGVKNITVIHNGVTLPDRLPKIKKNQKTTLMYLGALAKDKGIEDAITVFNKLIQKHPDWNYWVVGKGDPDYLTKIKKNADKRITFFGYVDQKKKFELLAQAHVLVNPSIREGWGLVNIEANSVGTPVVGYDVAGIRDSVVDKETGLIVNDRSITQFIEAITRLVSNKSLYNKTSRNAVKWVQKFSWNSSTDESRLYVKEIIEHHEK